jgi:uncharacterized membrane protein
VFHLTLEQGSSLTTMLAVGLAALLLAGWFYRRTFRELGRRRWRLLFALRALAIALIVLLLFRPVFSFEREVQQRRALIFLVDTSASMSTRDDASGETRFERARGRVLDWASQLQKDFDVHLVAFSESATALDQPGDLVHWKADGKATSLTRALTLGASKVRRQDVEAVFLLSDGIHNAVGDPVETAQQGGVVVHTVGVGNSLRASPSYQDILVTGLECAEQLPINNRARLTASLDAAGLAGRVVQVAFEEDGKPLGTAEVVLDDTEGAQQVPFEFTPTVKGRHTYTARVDRAAQEKIIANNQRSAYAYVIDHRIRVLYIEGTLRAEYGALVSRFLSRDPDLEFCALVQTRPNVFVQRTNIADLQLKSIPEDPATLKQFDVFLLGDLDSTYLKPAAMQHLIERVREGAGLIMLGGYHSLGPGGYGSTPLGAILPVELGDRKVGQMTEAFQPTLTPDGRSHPIFANISKFFPSQTAPAEVAGLPPLQGCTRVVKARPGARVLAVYTGGKETATDPLPVFAVQPVGKGRTAVFTGDTTRNWHQVLRALDQETPFVRFWGQLVRWLAGASAEVKAEASVVARTDKVAYEPDAPIQVSAVVRDEQGEGAERARVVALIQIPQGKEVRVPLSALPEHAGHYQGTYRPDRSGSYRITVEAEVGKQTVQAEALIAEVGTPYLEFDRLDLDEKMLTRIANATGGRYVHLSIADRLLEELDARTRQRQVRFEQRLYWPPLFWLLFVGALTTEWALRRRYQLR